MTAGLTSSADFETDVSASGRGASRSRAKASAAQASTSTDNAGSSWWRSRPRWVRWILAALVLITCVTLVATPWWGPRVLAQLDYFHVRTVEIEGLRFTKPAELMKRLRVDTMQSVWQPLDSLVARLSDHPMVLRASVDRDLPGTLRVNVTERVPVALVPSRGGLHPADATGALLPIDPSVAPLDMPLAASADSALLSALDGLRLNAPDLYARVTEARRVNKDELRFVLNAGEHGAAGPAMMHAIVVRTTPDVTVARFRDILPVEADLARNHLRAIELDLRFKEQVIARQP